MNHQALFLPGCWLPGDVLTLKGWGHRGVTEIRCSHEQLDRLLVAFVAGGRQPMTFKQIRAVIEGEEPVSNHSERQHSTIGASGYARWSVCPGSVRLSEGLPSRDSEYSVEGTRAHEILEQCMNTGGDAWEFASEEGVTEEMVDGVQMFLDTVREDLLAYEKQVLEEHGKLDWPHASARPVVLIEQKFNLEPLGHPEAFGTADVAIFFPAWGLLRVYDFKYGAGIVVEAEGNGQTRYYAVGMTFKIADQGEPVEAVETIIVQPRCEHPDGYVRRERLTIDELNQWVDRELLPAIARTKEPEASLVEGPHCRFCPVKQAAACPLLDRYHAELAVVAEESKDPKAEARQLEDWELSERLTRINAVEMYIKALKDEAFLRLQRGDCELPGWKLVPKKADRVLKDGAEASAKEQWGESAYTEPALKSAAQLEKLKGGKEWVSEWAYKPDTGLTLAPDTDKREAVKVRPAREVFAGLIGKG